MTREAVYVTGIGLATSVGDGLKAHEAALWGQPRASINTSEYAPYAIHPLAVIDFDREIPKKSDQRQMELWQRIGTAAAGLALSEAGLKGKPEYLTKTHLIVAAGGGERDTSVDKAVLSGLLQNPPSTFINDRLMSDLRPTLFLAQLSNLLAGNISIVHGVVGSSRTFMGDEQCGVDAVRIAHARIAHGEADVVLVGGAFNAERDDLLLLYGLGDSLYQGLTPPPVYSRKGNQSGFLPGSMGAFMVLESATHAKARGARALAEVASVVSGQSRRQETFSEDITALWRSAGAPADTIDAVISGATGVEKVSAQEQSFLQATVPQAAVRSTGTVFGHGVEAQFILNVGLAALALEKGSLFSQMSPDEKTSAAVNKILVTSFGHWRGEGFAVLGKAGEA